MADSVVGDRNFLKAVLPRVSASKLDVVECHNEVLVSIYDTASTKTDLEERPIASEMTSTSSSERKSNDKG